MNQLPFFPFSSLIPYLFLLRSRTGCARMLCLCVRVGLLHYVHTFLLGFLSPRYTRAVVAYRPVEFAHSWFYMFHLCDMHTMNVNEPLMFLSYPPVYLPHRFATAATAAAESEKSWAERYIISLVHLHTNNTMIFCAIFFSLHLHHLHSSTFFSLSNEKQFLENPTVKLLWILFA